MTDQGKADTLNELFHIAFTWENIDSLPHLVHSPWSASAQVPDKPALARLACPGILHRS